MARACIICGEPLPEGSRTCSVCGTTAPDVPLATVMNLPKTTFEPKAAAAKLQTLTPSQRLCPSCGIVYEADYADSFCACGVELRSPSMGQAADLPAQLQAPATADMPAQLSPDLLAPQPKVVEKPPPGTSCLVLFGADKQPLHYFPLNKDATVIGRLDAMAGDFPDIDVTEWLEPAIARKISRKHAVVLRSRSSNVFVLRPLAGNTGTQIDADMVPALGDYPLVTGRRIILGGAVRLKFEIT
ncbi:MAG: FHA domain-containing protein [Gemmataceae bacterium]|nr:FHA domain-containing protein [Gemmataceae bacterium]MCI0738749.1 FHA domain-containing protein [Gemmataceae bacterium]